jgi:hypothetical protein
MTENRKPMRIAINVMRARLTVIGFNIAVVSFQINRLFSFSAAGGLKVPGIGHTVHVVADMALFLSLALSMFALLVFIMSSSFDEVGICTHWSLIAGQLLMFLALAQTTAGFFEPLVTTIETVAAKFPDKASEFHILRSGAIVAGGGAWFLATYGGPIVSLVRSPFHRRTNIAFGVAYLLILLVLCWITAQTVRVESVVSGDEPGLIFSLLRELVQPLRW